MESKIDHCRYIDISNCKYSKDCAHRIITGEIDADPRDIWIKCINNVGCMYYCD